jgi:hypothetical protein
MNEAEEKFYGDIESITLKVKTEGAIVEIKSKADLRKIPKGPIRDGSLSWWLKRCLDSLVEEPPQ